VTLQAGMGDNLYIDGYDVSGDIGALGRIACPLATQDTTPISMSAMRRLGLQRDGAIDYTAFWNPGAAADTAHSVHKTLPRTDRALMYCRGTVLGSHAASMVGKQITYDGARNADGSKLMSVSALANGFGLEWGRLLTAGKLTQTGAGNGTSIDLGATPASYSQGWAAYLHVFAFTGTSITVKVQDSADDAAWLDVASATFTAATAIGSERITAGPTSTATVRRYARLVSTGTFSNAVFAVNLIRYEAAGHQ
jgi:hypothetical protein